jgi:cold shock CspA family protein
MTRQSGTILRWPRHDFGFVRADNGAEIFIHIVSCPGWQQLPPGTRVRFTLDHDAQGRTRAAHVEVLDEADESPPPGGGIEMIRGIKSGRRRAS